jgi:flagellar biosynthesis protein FliR
MGLLDNSTHVFGVFLLVLARVGCLILTAPAFLGHYAPVMVRGLLAVLISFLVTPVCFEQAAPLPESLIPFLVMLIREAMLGLLIGLAIFILFSALQVAGQVISQASGLQMAEVIDASGQGSIPVTSRLLELLALAFFLTMNGHHQVLEAILSSFQTIPPGTAHWMESFSWAILEAMRQSFDVGLRSAAPIMLAVLLAVVLVGVLGRTIPQVNILAVGLSLNTLVILGMLFLSAGSAAWVFHQQAEHFIAQLRRLLMTG